MAAARHVLGDDVNVLEDIELKRPIVLSADESDAARVRLDVYSDDGSFVIVSSSGKPDAPWIEHTRGQIRRRHAADPPPRVA
jgi:polyketide synthase 12/myxalamid-type polyketide synthase MxaB